MNDAREAEMATSAELITKTCRRVEALLLEKNRAYSDSWRNPIRIFSRASPIEQLLVRLDDKISRLARGDPSNEDCWLDLCGYLILLLATRGEEG